MELYPFSLSQGRESEACPPEADSSSTLVLLFADPSLENSERIWSTLRRQFRQSVILGCSTAGNIRDGEIRDGSVEGVAIRFERTNLHFASMSIRSRGDSFRAGRELGQCFPHAGLRAVLLLSDGLVVNGSELVRGLTEQLPPEVSVSGGLAADGSRFERTWLITHDSIGPNRVAAVGLYGDHIQVTYGSEGGWDKFGIERRVTRSDGPVVYELDGKPALALYKQYLGERAEGLLATGLLFPLSVRLNAAEEHSVVRTILAVDEAQQSLTFAGDVPVNSYAQLMKANSERLIVGAALAAEQAALGFSAAQRPLSCNPHATSPFCALSKDAPSLAFAVSCVGRRLVLKQRAEEELEALSSELPYGTQQIGFYSYGEIAPSSLRQGSYLHNQTMTVTVLQEL